ncbi:MAG: ABC transporter permease, partial [Tannerellaceae bacterium]|nr:ABC transporter permease [Tannerellaceae bacterium]
LKYVLRKWGTEDAVKVISLSLGLVVALVLFSKVSFEAGYDSFYPDAKRIYRVERKVYNREGVTYSGERINAPLTEALESGLSEIELSSLVFAGPDNKFIKDEDNRIFKEEILPVDAGFFDLFGIRMLEGDGSELALEDRIYLSESLAHGLWGEDSAVGRKLVYDNVARTVAGVFGDIPENSLFSYNVFISLASYFRGNKPGWREMDGFCGYVRLAQGVHPGDVEAKIPSLLPLHFDVQSDAAKGIGYEYTLNPITGIHRSSQAARRIMLVCGLLAFTLLFVSAMNYVLISVASLAGRTMSISIHKCNGASSREVFTLLMAETLLYILAATLLSAALIQVLGGPVEKMAQVPVEYIFSAGNLWVFLAVVAALLLFSGVIPAFMYSSLSPTYLIQSYTVNRKKWKMGLMYVLFVGVSFMATLLLVVVWQYHVLINSDLGYVSGNLFFTEDTQGADDEKFDVLKDELSRMPGIASVSVTTDLPLDFMNGFYVYDDNNEARLFSSRGMAADKDFFETMGIEILLGRGFSENKLDYSEAIVNDRFVRMMGWTGSPLGRTFVTRLDGAMTVEVIGVIKDFSIYTLYQQEADYMRDPPLIVFSREKSNRDWWYPANRLVLRADVTNGDLRASLDSMAKQTLESETARFGSYNEKIEQTYNATLAQKDMIVSASVLMLCITVLGLFGYMQGEIIRREKEITIRRINGATFGDVLSVFLRHILLLSFPAVLTGFVLSYYVSGEWLQQFAVKIPLDFRLFFPVGIITLSVISASIYLHVAKAMKANILLSLKTNNR